MSQPTLPGARVPPPLRALAQEVRRLGPAVVIGATGSVLALVGALAPFSPAVHHTQRGWFIGVPWPPLSAELSSLVAAGLFWVGIILLVRGWMGVMRRVGIFPGAASPAAVVAVFALWAIPFLVGPPLMTRDPYSYAAQGEIYSQGFDPYRHTPEVLGGGEFTREVDPLWRATAAPYGPLFMLVARSATRLAAHNLLGSVIILKLACLAGVALIAGWLPRLARAGGHDPAGALAFAILNPITLLHLVGGAHNEAIMIGFLVVGLTLAREGRPLLGVAACVLAGAVKLPALAGVIFIAWSYASSVHGRIRVRRVMRCAAAAGATLVALALVAGTSWGWITLITTPTRVQSYLSPVTTTGIGISNTLAVLGVSRDVFLTAWQLAFIGLALVLSFRALMRVGRDGLARATGTALIWVAVLSPVLFPFYLTWGLIPLAAAGLGRLRTLAIAASIALSVALLPGGRDLLDAIAALGPWWVLGLLVALGAAAFPRHLPRLRWGEAVSARPAP